MRRKERRNQEISDYLFYSIHYLSYSIIFIFIFFLLSNLLFHQYDILKGNQNEYTEKYEWDKCPHRVVVFGDELHIDIVFLDDEVVDDKVLPFGSVLAHVIGKQVRNGVFFA